MAHLALNESDVDLATNNRGPSTAARPAVGHDLRELADATFQLASELRPILNDEAAAALDRLVREAEREACRIVVIGHVKAGKSTLVNALTQPPFAYPTTIVDTPGTNDPVRVGEALSREALESADVYIAVLNAQQALSPGDASLLGLLQGLQKSRLVVFVNRIDTLVNPALDGEAAVAHVCDKIAAEFPGVAIPVIAGSAMHASALGDLKAALSRLVLQGPTMLRLQRRQRALYEMVLNIELAARDELRSLEQLVAAAREGETTHWVQAAEDLKRFNALPAAIMARVKTAAQNFDRLKGEAIRHLDAALHDVARRDVLEARRRLLAQPRFTRHEHIWQHDTLPLRRDLDRELQSIYGQVAEVLHQVERTTSTEILDMVRELMPENSMISEEVPLSPIDLASSIGVLGDTVAIELDERWRAWWRLWHGPKQRARKLEQLLSAAFDRVVGNLLDTAGSALETYIVVSVQRFSQLVRDVGITLDRRKLDIEARRRIQAEKQPNGSAKPHTLTEDCEARLKRQTQRIRDCARIAGDLKLLVRRCAALGH